MSDSDVINTEIYHELLSIMGNEVHDLYNEFKNNTPHIIQDLSKYIADNDSDNSAASAHLLKSSSSNLGIIQVARVCADLESLSKKNDLQSAKNKITDLQYEFNRFLSHQFDIAC
ncbi:MAG: Hpt domain-containing protein [Gammaproteobacteria bacterium]|nr:Hpt domain-containing protein [Gammaproteobacteria bacterium]